MDAPPNKTCSLTESQLAELAAKIKLWGQNLGFQQVGITDTDLSQAESYFLNWLGQGHQGEMEWMARHGLSLIHI